MKRVASYLGASAVALWLAAVPAYAQQIPLQDKPFAEHKVVLQLSESDPKKAGLVISVANNLMKFYDPENTCLGKCRTVDHGDAEVDVATERRQLFAIPVEDAGWQSRAEAVAGKPFIVQQVINYPNGLPAYRIGIFQ
jgi:hypothetical protein